MKVVSTLPEVSKEVRRSEKWDETAHTLRTLENGVWGVVEENVKLFRSQAVRGNLGRRGNFEVAYRNGTVYAREVRS